MDRRCALATLSALGALTVWPALGRAGEGKSVALPAPQTDGGKPLMQALRLRQSAREYRSEPLPPQVLSNLLWAAFGVNRPDSGKRTAASAMNWQEIDLYCAMSEGLFAYEPDGHSLRLVLAEDLRSQTGRQSFVEHAPLNLVYVADHSRMGFTASAEDKALYSAADTGLISQNVYLFCASEGLATVVRGWVDRDGLAKRMKLRKEQRIVLAQTVGYPAT